MNTSSTLVEARQVSRVYSTGAEDVIALDSVDLTVGTAEMVAVVGPSGCGKTTLLNCLSGLDEPTGGEIVVEGRPLVQMSDAARTQYRAERMGFVFQAFNLLPVFTAAENVELPMALAGESAKASRQAALSALRDVGLEARASHRPAELSAGEQQRVAIARAFAHGPSIVWADEPTGNLDSENASKVVELLLELNRQRALTVVMVTHDDRIADRADRTVRMRDGKIVEE